MATISTTRSNGLLNPKASVQYVENVAVRSQEPRDIETVALVVTEPKADFKLQTIILDEIREDEVLVEMKYSGICHTDIVLQQGLLPMVEFPAVFGHEGAGFVRGIGSRVKNKSLNVGDAVLLSFNTCGTCKPCSNGHPAFCHSHAAVNHNAVRLTDRSTPARTKEGQSIRSQYFGHSSFAKMSVVNEKCVVKCDYPDQMGIYAPIGCGFQTGAGTVLNVLKPGPDDTLVVFGLGSVGLTALMAAKHMGVGQIIAVDIVPEKLQMVKELGATDTIVSNEQSNVVEAIKKTSKSGAGATFAIDCTGVLRVIEDMVACLAPQGTAAVVGVPPPDAKISIDPLMFLLDNKKLIGVIEGDSNPENFIPELIELHQRGSFPIEKLCRTYPVERLEDAIRDLHTGNLLPKPEDLVPFLDAAREAAEDRYTEPKYAYVREALCKVFDNCTESLGDGIEPSVILVEALQDERAILDRHNRIQTKAKPGRGGNPPSIPDELVNFPFRFMCLKDGDVILPTGFFEPIFQQKEVFKSPPPNFSKSSAANKVNSIGKLSDAPSPTHDFPDGNLTLAEIAAFLPQSIKSWDVADRIIWNGASSEDLTRMFNMYRGLNPKITINTVYLMFRGQMRKRTEAEHGYESWDSWIVSAQPHVKKPATFDLDSISVTGFRRPVVFENRPNLPAVPIRFKDLANGVAVWPEGDDALDLTRCVRWCVDHQEAQFYYPTDYQTVLQRVGGPLTPAARHSDSSALARFRSGTGRLTPRRRAIKDYSYSDADPNKKSEGTELGKRKRGLSAHDERAQRRRSNTGSPARQSRTTHSTAAQPSAKKATLFDIGSEDDTDDDAYQGPKRTKKNTDGSRRSGRNKTKITSYVYVDGAHMDEEDGDPEREEYQEYGDGDGDEDEFEEGVDDMDMDE
ncbi:hypothetical protein N0V86_006603 [Didymella sp. IMI 355093]|nr:hypothetical protein N0V86_006603 [Didymella sp. IMI 355093]